VPSNPGHALADASHGIDTTDRSAVLALAERERIDGVVAPGTDVAVETAAFVAERLGLPGPGERAARILTRKRAFRELLQRAGLPCPRVLDAGARAAPFGESRRLVKPNRSSGSKGVFIVASASELEARIGESRRFSIDGDALVEELIEGTQHTCEAFLQEGGVALALVTDRDTASPPHTATKGHRVPSRLSAARQRDALDAIERIARLTELDGGPLDCDFVVGDDGRVVVIELTPRLGGNSLSRLFDAALDFDLVSAAVCHACGDPVRLPPQRPPRPAAVAILGCDRAGRVRWRTDEERSLADERWLRMLSFDVAQGDPVEAFVNGRHRVGEALVVGSTRDEVDARLAELAERLAVRAE